MSAVAEVAEALGWALLVAGSALSLVAAIGLVRFPDLLTRMHAATKPQVLGLICVALGAALVLQDAGASVLLLVVVLAQLLTAPVSAHLLARASCRAGQVRADLLTVDELERDLAARRGETGPPGD